MKIPADFHLFSREVQEYILSCQPVERVIPERPAQATCTESSHIFISDGGEVEDNLNNKCKCGKKTLAEILDDSGHYAGTAGGEVRL